MEKTATFSTCRKYRYSLWRRWDDFFATGYAMFIGLNPSTADETKDDPTVRRCIGYARAWGYAGLCMTNLFAFRATLPGDMMSAENPVGVENNRTLVEMAENAGLVVAAWGIHGMYLGRDNEVSRLIPDLYYLKLTRNGFPAHPLYLPKRLKPIRWWV